MWVESVLVVGDQILDAAELNGWALTVGACAEQAPRMLLVHVVVTEDSASAASYSALTVFALAGDLTQRTGTIDLAQPLVALSAAEQLRLRGYLVERNWPAWARAPLSVRAPLGDTAAPVALAAAARDWMLPLPTLSGAAVAERLPTIRAGDRHLIYSVTIGEALERGLLQPQRGRPRHRHSKPHA